MFTNQINPAFLKTQQLLTVYYFYIESIKCIQYMTEKKNKTENNELELSDMKNHKPISSIRKASYLIDSVASFLCQEIVHGQLNIDLNSKNRKFKKSPNFKKANSQFKIQSQPLIIKQLDPEEHKLRVKKFIKSNRSVRKNLQMKSIDIQEKIRKSIMQEEEAKVQARNKSIQQRRKQIQERRLQKKRLMDIIKQSFVEQNYKLKEIKNKKFLYQAKSEQFQIKYVLPKLEEQKRILENKRQAMKPMNIAQIIQHEKQYSKMKIEQKAKLLFKNQFIQTSNKYNPPQFVPKAFIIAEQERLIQEAEQELKNKQIQINQIKKKKFLQNLEKSKSNQKINIIKQLSPQIKQPPKIELSREDKKALGNQYMRELFKNHKRSKKRRIFSDYSQKSNKQKRHIKSHYELEIVKEERIHKTERIRVKKIDEILNNDNHSDYQKYQRLKIETARLDRLVADKPIGNNLLDREETASLVLNSIHAKVAMLQLTSPQN